MYGIGAQLRAERLRQNVALGDVASETRISVRYLEGIEAEDYEKLPGLLFTRNFVRQYALALHVNPDSIVERLPKLDESMVQLPVPPARSRARQWNPSITSVGWLVLLGAAGLSGYFYFNGFPRLRVEFLPSAQHTAQAASKAPAAPAVVAAPPPPVPDAQAAVAPEAPPVSSPQSLADNTPVTPLVTEPAAAPSDRAVQVVVTAHNTSWVQMTADGKTAWTGTLRPNETKTISADSQVRVLTGNAGGLTISLNGKTLDPLGPAGQVRSVRLTPDGAELSAPRPVAPDPL